MQGGSRRVKEGKGNRMVLKHAKHTDVSMLFLDIF